MIFKIVRSEGEARASPFGYTSVELSDVLFRDALARENEAGQLLRRDRKKNCG
jgi:hypothetical protein